MEYSGPYDHPENPNASYVNGNPATGLQGSIPPAGCFEFHQREIVNFIADNKVQPDNLDLHQLSRGLQNSSVMYGVDSGSGNSVVLQLNPVPLTHTPGMTIRAKKSATPNTGSLTLNIGLGTDQLLKADGSAFNSGEMPANMVFEATWDGSSWKTINFLGVQSTTQSVVNNYTTHIPYCLDTSNTANIIVAPYNPPITSVIAGDIISVKLHNNFAGGNVTITVNALSPINVKRGDGQNTLKSDGYLGQVLLLEFDGVNFQIINSLLSAAPLPIQIGDVKSTQNVALFSPGAWRTRDLNTVLYDPFGLVTTGLLSIGNNRFTLGIGNWIIGIKTPFFGAWHQTRLWNVTDNAPQIKGSFIVVPSYLYQNNCNNTLTYSFIDGYISLSSPKTFEVQHICITNPQQGQAPGWGYGIYDPNNPPTYMIPVLNDYMIIDLTWSR